MGEGYEHAKLADISMVQRQWIIVSDSAGTGGPFLLDPAAAGIRSGT